MGKMKLVGLRCEYEINPLGIHRTNPLFSWKVETEERNSYQSAYQIVAAASMEMLAVGNMMYGTADALHLERIQA